MGKPVQSVKQHEGHKELTHDPRKLRRRRVAAGLSVTELALRAQCSKAHVSMLEDGRHHSASPDQLARFAEVLGCRIEDLMPDEPAANGNGAA